VVLLRSTQALAASAGKTRLPIAHAHHVLAHHLPPHLQRTSSKQRLAHHLHVWYCYLLCTMLSSSPTLTANAASLFKCNETSINNERS
jgi:hypothetical protein